METAITAAHPQTPVLTTQIEANERKAVDRKPQALVLPRVKLFPDMSSVHTQNIGTLWLGCHSCKSREFPCMYSTPLHPTKN